MPEVKKFETKLLIAGGGVAGVSAALTAARSGLKTLLIESQISLGGLATNGYVNGIAGMVEGTCAEWLAMTSPLFGTWKLVVGISLFSL